MYNIGDKIYYPLHGAGIIKSIEEQTIIGNKETYYIVAMPGEVTIMVPTEKADTLGLRPIVSKEEASEVLNSITPEFNDDGEQWSARYQENKEKLKNGNIHDISDIYKSLSFRNKHKNLSTTEKKMMLNAKQVLLSELSYSLEQPAEQLEEIIEDKILESYKNYEATLED